MKNIEMTAVFEPCDEGGLLPMCKKYQGLTRNEKR